MITTEAVNILQLFPEPCPEQLPDLTKDDDDARSGLSNIHQSLLLLTVRGLGFHVEDGGLPLLVFWEAGLHLWPSIWLQNVLPVCIFVMMQAC